MGASFETLVGILRVGPEHNDFMQHDPYTFSVTVHIDEGVAVLKGAYSNDEFKTILQENIGNIRRSFPEQVSIVRYKRVKDNGESDWINIKVR